MKSRMSVLAPEWMEQLGFKVLRQKMKGSVPGLWTKMTAWNEFASLCHDLGLGLCLGVGVAWRKAW